MWEPIFYEYQIGIDNEDDIEMLPMESVRITWKGETFDSDAPGKLQDNWRSNTGTVTIAPLIQCHTEWISITDLPPILTFQFMCRWENC